MLAARAIATIQNPQDIMVISGKAQGQRAVLKFGYYTGAQAIAGRFSPGALTNQNLYLCLLSDKFYPTTM